MWRRTGFAVVATTILFPLLALPPAQAQTAPPESPPVQTAVVDEDFGYLNLATRGGRPPGGGVDGDGAPPLRRAGLTATFSNFSLNGIPFDDWQTCRSTGTVDDCLATLGDTLREQHPGAIGGDVFEFDVTVTNTSPADSGTVLTTFAFQSKFSESPALGSRIGDKLFSAECKPNEDGDCPITTNAQHPLIGVKKNGTANGLYGGKVKGICITSSDDYPASINLGVQNEDLECAGGRTFDFDTNQTVLQAADGSFISPGNIKLPKGLRPGESTTLRMVLDSGTDDGALQRAYGGTEPSGNVGPLVGYLENAGEEVAAEQAADCMILRDAADGEPQANVLDVVNFGDVKIIRDSSGRCVPSFEPLSKNQFLTVPRRNWAFTDILDTRDDYSPVENPELPTVLTGDTGKFSFLDFGNLREGEMNFFEVLRGFGEHGATLDPSCATGGSRAGSCGGAAYVPWGEFYGLASGKLVRQEVQGSYGASQGGTTDPSITATIATGTQGDCRPNRPVKCKTTDAFEPAGQPNPGDRIGASATADFRDVVVIGDDKTTVANEGGQAGGNKVRFTVDITNTSTSSDIRLTSFNFQTKQRGLTDINELDGTSILGRQDLRTGADGDRTLVPECGDDPMEAKCFDPTLGIGRFPNVLGNSLLSSTFAGPEPNDLDPHFEPGLAGVPGKLEAIKKNGTFQPLTRTDLGVANYICIKSGAPAPDQDADETCSGSADSGLLPGETQSVRLEMDYGDFRGLILRVAPGTLQDYVSPADDPFGLIALRGDFDCRDQRRLPYCHPDLVGDDWFTSPTSLEDVEFVTVHQPGEAATVMNFTDNFGELLAMAGFAPTAEFWQGSTQVQVRGEYLNLPGRDEGFITVSVTSPSAGSTVTGTVDVEASTAGSATPDQVEFFAQLDDGTPTSIGVDTDVSDGWSTTWDTDGGGFADGGYTLTAVATAGTLNATSSGVTVTLANGLTVDIVQPADQAVVTGETTLAAKTFGLVDADGVTFAYRKAGSTGTPIAIGPGALTSGQWEVVWDTTTVPADRYEVIATATNEAETATDSIVVEVVQLSVKIVAPDDGAVLFKTVPLKAEVISALPVTSVEFFYDAAPDPFNGIDDPPVSAGEATFKPDTGLWEVDWNTRAVDDTPLTKPRTQDTLGVVVTTAGGTAGDAIDVRVTNMLTTRIFLPDNQEDLLGRTDLEALLTGQSDITSVRFDLYDLADLDPEIFRPFGEASSDGSPIVDFKYGRPLGNPEYPTGSPVHQIGPASPEGASRWVIRNWDTRTVPDGTYGLVARATDSEGRKASYMIETYIVNDLTVDITSPSAGDKVGPYVALQARTGGLFPVTSVVFTAGEDTVPATESPAGSGRWKAVWDATGKANGSYDITATATNTAAKTATDTVTVTVQNGSGGTLEAFFPYDWSNCEELTCSFVDGSKGGATSWSWDFGDTVSGDTSTLQVPDAYEYSAPGVYTVTLTVDNGTATDEYTRTIPVGNIGIDGFNTNPINDAGTETITWTSALKDFTYTVGDEIFVPVHWKTTLGTATFDSLPEAVLFTPEEADGTDPELVGIADEGMLFKITFTEVQFRGGTGIFKGKVNLGINVDVDYGNGGSAVDWEARLGTNVDVTNSGTIDPGNFLHVWVTEPDAGAVLTGTQTLAATPLASGTVSGVEFFANGTKIGDATKTDTSRPDGGRWTLDWETPSLPGGEYVLVAAARGGGLEARSTGITVTVQNTTPAPTVTLTADPTTVISGGSSTLTWTTTNATACTATGGGGTWYNGSLPGGSASTGALTATTTYSLTCTGPGGTSEPASTTVTVPAPPTLTFSAASSTVEYNQGTTLTWSATNATSCTASGDWGGSKSTTGSESTGPLTAAKTYTLACTGDGGSVSKTVQVMVEPTFTGSATKQRGGWSATVSVTGAQPSTTISGTWSVGGTPNSCNTNGSGTCNFTRTGLKNNLSSVTWTHTASGKKVTINRP